MDRPTSASASVPRLQVQAGLVLLFGGAIALLLAVAGELGPQPWRQAWFIPQSPLAWTAAATALCWGVWALGAALRQARGEAGRPPTAR